MPIAPSFGSDAAAHLLPLQRLDLLAPETLAARMQAKRRTMRVNDVHLEALGMQRSGACGARPIGRRDDGLHHTIKARRPRSGGQRRLDPRAYSFALHRPPVQLWPRCRPETISASAADHS